MKKTEIGGIPISLAGISLETPEIFISSTYKDLEHVRYLLEKWMREDLGYHAHVFESKDFPRTLMPNPMDATLQVIDRSNIYVLIIDTEHYGTPYEPISDNKSITWVEWLRALKYIPFRIILVNKSVKSKFDHDCKLLKEGKIQEHSEDIFHFIKDLFEQKEWVHFYNNIDEIKEIIKVQMAKSFGGLIKYIPKLKWFLSEQATRIIESSCETVWIASPDLYWDTTDHDFRKFVLDNICSRNISYKYLVPDNKKIRDNIESFIKSIDSYLGVSNAIVEFFFVKKPITPFEFAIYNPEKNDEMGIFVNLMQVDNHRNKFNVEMGNDFCALYKAEFKKGCSRNIRCITKNIGHLADSSKNEDDSNK